MDNDKMFVSVSRSTVAMPSDVVQLLVVCGKESPELEVLHRRLPQDRVHIVAIAQKAEDFESTLTDAQWASVDVLLACGILPNQANKRDLERIWPRLTSLKWMHTTFAGLEHLLFPQLVDGPVILTNAKGVYSNSLAEFALLACKWFAMDVPRLLKAKGERRWDQFPVEELRGRTMGVIGFGDIGQACARLGKAYQMRILALRRSLTLTESEVLVVEKIFPPSAVVEMVAACDYIIVSTPYTAQTHELMSAAAVGAMKPTAVLVNVGRGKCVDEQALVAALSEGRIRGAGLDVFYEEPLPPSSPLWGMDNVFMSPHCADRTREFQFETMDLFVANMERYLGGLPLQNVCDKRTGY